MFHLFIRADVSFISVFSGFSCFPFFLYVSGADPSVLLILLQILIFDGGCVRMLPRAHSHSQRSVGAGETFGSSRALFEIVGALWQDGFGDSI